MDHSVPSQTEEGSTGDKDFDRWVEFLRTFSRARLCCFCTLYDDRGLTGSRYPTRPELFFRYPTRPDPKIENDWVPGN